MNLKKSSMLAASVLALSLPASGCVKPWMGSCDMNASFLEPTLIAHKDHYELQLAAPGFAKKDITITLRQDGLLIKGQHKLDANKEDILFGNTSNAFVYLFPVSSEVDREGISSELKDGILKIKAKKDPKKAPKEIRVM